jgi:hypothetical protein
MGGCTSVPFFFFLGELSFHGRRSIFDGRVLVLYELALSLVGWILCDVVVLLK